MQPAIPPPAPPPMIARPEPPAPRMGPHGEGGEIGIPTDADPTKNVTLFTHDGQAVPMAPQEATKALMSGQLGIGTSGRIPVRLAGGQVGTVAPQDLQSTLQAGGQLASAEEHRKAEVEAKYGDWAHGAEAAAEGALSGATFNLSDALIAGVGGEAAKQHLKNVQEAHPYVHAAGEVGGMLLPLALSGGASAPLEGAEGASLLARGAEAAGSALRLPTELAGGIGEFAGAATKAAFKTVTDNPAAQKVISGLVKSATEGGAIGALQGAGGYISEAALGDENLNGEKLLAAVGHGALLGAVTGGALNAAGELGTAVIGKASRSLEGAAEMQAFRALNPLKAGVTAAERAGGPEAIGRRLLDEGIIEAGDKIDTIAPKVAAAREKAGDRVGELLQGADKAGFEGPRVHDVLNRINAEVMPDLQKLPSLNQGTINKIEGLKADIASAAGNGESLSFQSAAILRRRIDESIKWNHTDPFGKIDVTGRALQQTRWALENELEKAGETASKKIGGSFLEDYKGAKKAYQELSVADGIAQKAMQGHGANRALSPTDYLAGHAGSVLGSVAGGMGGHVASAALGGPVAGLASAFLHHVVRERGNSVAAVVLDKLSSLGAARQAVMAFDREVDRGVAKLTETGRRVEPSAKPALPPHHESSKGLLNAIQNPDAHAAAIQKVASSLGNGAPKIAQSFSQAAIRATTYLASQLPPKAPQSPLDHGPPLPISETHVAAFERQYQAIHDPASLLRHANDGTLSPDEVKAVEAVMPDTLADIRKKVMAQFAGASKDVPYEKRVALSHLMGEALDPSLQPDNVALMQSLFAAPPKGHGGGGKGHGRSAPAAVKEIPDLYALPGQGKHGL